jgi:hypothetical protein
MARLKVTEPIISGSIRGSIDLSTVSNTDWNDLTSADFIDVTTGSACASGSPLSGLVSPMRALMSCLSSIGRAQVQGTPPLMRLLWVKSSQMTLAP